MSLEVLFHVRYRYLLCYLKWVKKRKWFFQPQSISRTSKGLLVFSHVYEGRFESNKKIKTQKGHDSSPRLNQFPCFQLCIVEPKKVNWLQRQSAKLNLPSSTLLPPISTGLSFIQSFQIDLKTTAVVRQPPCCHVSPFHTFQGWNLPHV